ncbi:hypothetical protein IEO21_05339 [Rhodonia placenta]|uniref:Uncharacterized protein n=1 Tax=Rhodonia placenta TaxID=104341 RepID=A0A8H7P2M7_9APHY|nr:hypothetical protein IEO21_05339 [Postia placenta]
MSCVGRQSQSSFASSSACSMLCQLRRRRRLPQNSTNSSAGWCYWVSETSSHGHSLLRTRMPSTLVCLHEHICLEHTLIVTIVEDYDFNVVGRLCRLFPESHLAQLITAYFGYMSIEIPDEEEESKQEQAKGDIDYVDIIIVGVPLTGMNRIATHAFIPRRHSAALQILFLLIESSRRYINLKRTSRTQSKSQRAVWNSFVAPNGTAANHYRSKSIAFSSCRKLRHMYL